MTGGAFPPGHRFADGHRSGRRRGNDIDAAAVPRKQRRPSRPHRRHHSLARPLACPGSRLCAAGPWAATLLEARLRVWRKAALPYSRRRSLGYARRAAWAGTPWRRATMSMDRHCRRTRAIADMDGDLRADAVDTDDDADGVSDFIDNCPLVKTPARRTTTTTPWATSATGTRRARDAELQPEARRSTPASRRRTSWG